MPLPLTVSCFSKIQIGFRYWLTRIVLDKVPLNGHVCVKYDDTTAYFLAVRRVTVTHVGGVKDGVDHSRHVTDVFTRRWF